MMVKHYIVKRFKNDYELQEFLETGDGGYPICRDAFRVNIDSKTSEVVITTYLINKPKD